jgi:hypothetical protein
MDKGVWLSATAIRQTLDRIGARLDWFHTTFNFEEDAGKIRLIRMQIASPTALRFMREFPQLQRDEKGYFYLDEKPIEEPKQAANGIDICSLHGMRQHGKRGTDKRHYVPVLPLPFRNGDIL